MTLTKYDRFAFLPVRCDYCNRLFWLEGYNTEIRQIAGGRYELEYCKCFKCIEAAKKGNLDMRKIEIDIDKLEMDNIKKGLYNEIDNFIK